MRASIKIHARGDEIARVEGTCGLTGMINSRGYAPRTSIPIPYGGMNAKSISTITLGESNFINLKQCRFNSLWMELPRDKKNFVIDDEFSYFLMDDLLREKKNEDSYEDNRIDRA